MRKAVVALLILIVAAIAIVAQLPARQAFGWFRQAAPALGASDVQGTLWSGQAAGVRWSGYHLGELRWTIHPLGLLTGDVNSELALRGAEISGQGALHTSLDGSRITGRQLDLQAPAAWLQQVLATPFLQLGGTLDAELQRIEFVDGWLTALDGSCHWRDAVVSGRIVAPLGELVIDWTTTEQDIVGVIADRGGPLSADGTVVIVDRGYRLDVLLSAEEDNIPLRQALAVLGHPDDNGVVRLTLEGPLLPIR